MDNQQKITSGEIKRALAAKYPTPAFVYLNELRSCTGGSPRSADAFVMSMYPSTGLEISGFEIKVSRGDWLRELKQPGKADEIFVFCDRWWIVAPPGVVDPAELPKTWGLMELKNDKLVAKVKAPLLKPKELDRPIVASLLRHLLEKTRGYIPPEQIKDRIEAAREEGRQAVSFKVNKIERDLEELRAKVREFEDGAGVKIDSWRHGAKAIGEAVNFVLEGGVKGSGGLLTDAIRGARLALSSLERAKKLIEEETQQTPHSPTENKAIQGSRGGDRTQ